MTAIRRLAAISSPMCEGLLFKDRHHKPGKSGMAHIHPTRQFAGWNSNGSFGDISTRSGQPDRMAQSRRQRSFA
jgi:hypothetical protein